MQNCTLTTTNNKTVAKIQPATSLLSMQDISDIIDKLIEQSTKEHQTINVEVYKWGFYWGAYGIIENGKFTNFDYDRLYKKFNLS